jgi:bacteriorhodopsin
LLVALNMPAVIFARNDALDVNPQSGDARLSDAGSDWLWAVTAIYIVSFVCLSYSYITAWH